MSITKDNMTYTENGAIAYSSTNDKVLDLFSRLGGLRKADKVTIERLYLDARSEDKELADNIVLYARNIRDGGLGERRIGRILLKTLALIDPSKVRRNLDTIVAAGRWDDLYEFEGTSVETDMFEFIKKQFRKDIIDMNNGEPISLLAKWLPSSNTSSAETRRKARKTYTYFGISERIYRKTLSELRKYLDVVERKMSANQFESISYPAVPSNAMTKYRYAFYEHDCQRFSQYIEDVKNGKSKINSSVTYPYEIIRPYSQNISVYSYDNNRIEEDKVLEEQWKALPNYVEGNHDVVVMSDVSGSMLGTPMAVSTSLGIYFAERNKGAYQNLMMTFTDQPRFFVFNPEDSVCERVKQVSKHVGYSTNLDGALCSIYEKAKECGVAPEALIVISDGEIDRFINSITMDGFEDLIERWQRIYSASNLKAPKIIMWNVESRGSNYICKKGNLGVSFISGSSASSFKELITLINEDAVSAMIKILTKPQFSWK